MNKHKIDAQSLIFQWLYIILMATAEANPGFQYLLMTVSMSINSFHQQQNYVFKAWASKQLNKTKEEEKHVVCYMHFVSW